MSWINPFAAPLSQSTGVQRQQSADKSRQVRRAQQVKKNSALSGDGDQFEQQVESADEVNAIHDEDQQHPQQRKKNPRPHRLGSQSDDVSGDGEAHLDLTA